MPRSKELDMEINMEHAEAMLETLAERIEVDYERSEKTVVEALVVLRHYCVAHGLSYAKAEGKALAVYTQETM